MTKQSFIDIETQHQVLLERYKSGVILSLAPEVRRMEEAILAVVAQANITTLTGLRKLQAELKELQAPLCAAIIEKITDQFDDLIESEMSFEIAAIQGSIGKQISTAASTKVVRWSVNGSPIFATGDTTTQMFSNWTQYEMRQLRQLVAKSFASDGNLEMLIRAIKGTSGARFKDGAQVRTRRTLETLARTTLQSVSSDSRMAVWQANSDIISRYRLIATLDSRTSAICRSLDQKTFIVGKGPMPPLHPNCRTTAIPEFSGSQIGGTRSSLHGYVDGNMSYYEWLKRQPSAFINDTIGPKRGKLLRDGGLTANEFADLSLNSFFKPLTLTEMRLRNPGAFTQAGL